MSIYYYFGMKHQDEGAGGVYRYFGIVTWNFSLFDIVLCSGIGLIFSTKIHCHHNYSIVSADCTQKGLHVSSTER